MKLLLDPQTGAYVQQRPYRLRLRSGVLLEEVCGRPVVLDVDRELLFELEVRAAEIVRELTASRATVVSAESEADATESTRPSRLEVIAALHEAGLLVDATPPAGAL